MINRYSFNVSISRPGLPDINLGFHYASTAAAVCHSLRTARQSAAHIPGTTISWSNHQPDVTSQLDPVPTNPGTLAQLIAEQTGNHPYGHQFPDLWDRLHAQTGYENARRIWADACRYLDEPPVDEEV